MIGKSSEYLGQSYIYIETYAQKAELSAAQGCLRVMSDVEKVLNLILEGNNVFSEDQSKDLSSSLHATNAEAILT